MRTGLVALGVCLGLAGGLATLGLGEDAPARREGAAAAVKPESPLKPYMIPAANCKDCHSQKQEAGNVADRICRMIEYPIWDAQDKHKIAYKVLAGSRAREMGVRLNLDVTKSASCTSCHGTSVADAEEAAPFSREDNGVSCTACHGPYLEWVQKHQFPKVTNWRKNTRREKEALFGMTDLWDPVTRATKCASCHIGNAGERKIVTHAMYAAGHPPLPGLETATFSEAQPRHWQYLREKAPAVQAELGFNSGKREQTELVVVSGIVALRETMRLFTAEARDDPLLKETETHWPDFARFDCYACHHDLKVPSWRQARGYAGRTPGRPPAPTWPDVLVRLGITVADPTGAKGRLSEYQHALEIYRGAAAARPFGNREQSAAAATALANWADAVSHDLRGMFGDPKQAVVEGTLALRLLQQLAQMAVTETLDYDSARQIAWATRIILEETKAVDPKALKDPALETLVAELFDHSQFSLPTAGKQAAIADTLPGRLSAVFNFDPERFRTDFTELLRHLPAQ